VLLYYITDRTQFPGDHYARQRALLAKIAEAALCGVDIIQLREKDLSARDLETLARAALRVVRENARPGTENRERGTRLLINSRTDIAIACGADGVHLRSHDVSPSEVRRVWTHAKCPARPLVSVSCHSADEVAGAASEHADFAVLAPVFEKKDTSKASPLGLGGLREICRPNIPVLALGGITLRTAHACLDAGAAGVAGIRLFQENDIARLVRRLKG
jgi:thiamine-phosphate pyrophosphorylase